MSKLQEYIQKVHNNDPMWFQAEVQDVYNQTRINKVLSNKNYLNGVHSVLYRPDVTHKGTEFKTSKMILQTIKTILNFKSAYILGNKATLSGSPESVSVFNGVYRKGGFHKNNYSIAQNVISYGDSYEVIYWDGAIKSKLIASEDGYPIYNDRLEYVGFIEYYHDAVSKVETYVLYDTETVSVWSNVGGNLALVNQSVNLCGLPIHYKNTDELFGRSVLDDLKPIVDKLEILLNRLDDAVWTLSMNPLGVVSGQKLSESVDGEGLGYVLSLEDGAEFSWAVGNLDAPAIQILVQQLLSQLFVIAQVPSTIFGQSNISNVGSVALSLLFGLADNAGKELAIYLNEGFDERHEQIKSLLIRQGVPIADEFIDVIYNWNKPVDVKERADVLHTQFEDGCLSKRSYVELSSMTSNVSVELERLKEEEQQTAPKPVDTRVSILDA